MKQIFNSTASAIAIALVVLTACSQSDEAASAASSSTGAANAADAQLVAQAVTPAMPKADANTPLEQYAKIESGNQLMFAYYALSGLPVDYEKIAQVYSQDYARTADTFKKNDILTALKPRIDAEIAKAKTQRYFKFNDQPNLSHYDFANKSFAINNAVMQGKASSYFNDNPAYNIGITNGEQFAALKVADENLARSIEKMLTDGTGVNFQMYLFAQDVDPSITQVKFQIVKVKLSDKRGTELLTQ